MSNKLKVNQKNGTMILTNRPKLERVGDLSKVQIDAQRRFVSATQYASRQTAKDGAMREEYAKRITDKKRTAFLVALSDFLKAPEVTLIDTAKYLGNIGDAIEIMAYDDFKVVSVRVTITGADGTLLEQGDAVQDGMMDAKWIYTCTVANATLPETKINAVASDKPGNKASLDKVM